MGIFKNLFKGASKLDQEIIQAPPLHIEEEVNKIKSVEEKHNPKLGERIHHFDFMEFDLSLDRDVTEMYRLVAFEGKEKRFSFTIKCKQGNHELLQKAFEEIINFLKGERKLKNLPNNELLKGHFFD